MLKCTPQLVAGLVLIACSTAHGQNQVPFDSEAWSLLSGGHELTEYRGQPALYLMDGYAVLSAEEIRNGVIEFEIAFSGERGFVGAFWRMREGSNYEHFYMRPHQSGNPDASQYTPVFNGVTGWQLYHGTGYSAPVEYTYQDWIPVRIEFWEDQARVFLGNLDRPVLEIPELKHAPTAGKVGLMVAGRFAPAWFANFSWHSFDAPPFERIPVAATVADGAIMSWEVSSAFDSAALARLVDIDPHQYAGLSWRTLESEPNGVANLARLHGVRAGADTVFARTTLRSEGQATKSVRFGYSDRVRVYFNGRLLYAGDRTAFSRDYRYLGTIGPYYRLYLPLESGDNELLFAVTEGFGGWGIMASVEED